MASRTKLTDTATLELYRVALENVETQPEIAANMADLGYDSVVIAEGKHAYKNPDCIRCKQNRR